MMIRRVVLKSAPVGVAVALFGVAAVVEARGGRCELCRRKRDRKPRCGSGMKCCGKECVDRADQCCGGVGYLDCSNGQEFDCTPEGGVCCNPAGHCNPADRACP